MKLLKSADAKKIPDIIIPASALAGAKFLEQGEVTMTIMENMVILTKPNMSVRELESVAGTYLTLASSLLDEYYEKTGEYPDLYLQLGKTDGGEDVTEDCEDCIHNMEGDCDGTLHIPPCMLLEAGISPDMTLQFMIRDGSILITAVDEDDGGGDDE